MPAVDGAWTSPDSNGRIVVVGTGTSCGPVDAVSVEYAVDTGRPAVVLASDALADALYDADVPEADQPLEATLVDSETLADAAATTSAECLVLTPDDPLDPLKAAETLPVVYYAPRDALSGERVRELAAATDVDYVPANDDAGDNALLRSRVSERVAAERVRDDRDIRAAAMDQAGVGITVADAGDDEPLVYVNRGFETITGYTAADALGQNCRFLQGDDTDPEAVAALREAIDADVSETVEVRNYRADGTPFWNRVTVAPVYDDGAVTHYVGIQDDVTEQVAAQRARRRMVELTSNPEMDFEAKVEALLELGCERFDVDVGFLSAIDDEFEVVAADSAHPGLQPGATESLSTTYCRRTIAADEPLSVEDAAEEWADDPAYERWELACYVGANVEVDGELYGTLCFADTEHAREFTDSEKTFVKLLATWVRYELERRERERRLERENERLSEFASVVSHDLRNPLGVAQGHLEVLAAGDADDATVDEIATSLDRMEALIEDVLTLARDGEVVDDPEPTSLPATATEAWRVVDAPDASLDVDQNAPHLYADPERLRTVFENLFRNAVEHGDATTLRVGVDADNTVLYVEDDGTGIPESERDDVFEHGFTTNEDGTGFGLAIVREIADAHGWRVSLGESDTGGARFEFAGVDVVEE